MAAYFCCWRPAVSSPPRREPTPLHRRKTYTLNELRRATKNFSSANVIGKGLFATVYRGKLRNGKGDTRVVAIKRYNPDFSKEFQVELSTLSRLNHRNIVNCLGSCILKDEKLIVLEYGHHGSLYNYIHHHKPPLSWTEKVTVALGVAEGLKYLRVANIIHRDPNSTNIILDKTLVPKIADLSLALKAFRAKEEEAVHVPFAGTPGYLDPAYCSQGTLSTGVDVYVFGVVLMELITGKPAIGPSNGALLVTEMHQNHSDRNEVLDFADRAGGRSAPCASSVKIVAGLALRCTDSDPNERPRLNEVLVTLEEALRLAANDISGKKCDSDNSQTLLL